MQRCTTLQDVTDSIERAAAIKRSLAWDGQVFRNQMPTSMIVNGRFKMMRRFLFERGEREPPAQLPSQPVDPAVLAAHGFDGVRVTWLGHSTAWIEIDGKTVLIDPVWSKRASPLTFAGPKRFQPVPLELAELPLPEVVIVSHDHYDHLDHDAVIALGKRGAKFVLPLGVGGRLEKWGVSNQQLFEVDWFDTREIVPGLAIHAMPARHFSGRTTGDRNHTLWASWVIEGTSHRVFFGGDGGMDEDNFSAIGTRFGGFDLTMLEIGAFDEMWASIHLGPVNAVRAHRLLGGKTLLPVHWGTFNLGFHAWDAPGEELLVAVAGQPDVSIALPKLGQSIIVGETMPRDPWWRAIKKNYGALGDAQVQVSPT